MHVHGRADNEQEWLEMLLGRGSSDGDMYGYPGQAKDGDDEEDDPDEEYPDLDFSDRPF